MGFLQQVVAELNRFDILVKVSHVPEIANRKAAAVVKSALQILVKLLDDDFTAASHRYKYCA